MDEQPAIAAPKDEKHSINWGALILWPFVILLLYVLCAGPVIKMMEKGHISYFNQYVWKFYTPLYWAYDKTPLHKPLGMYLHLWNPNAFLANGENRISIRTTIK